MDLNELIERATDNKMGHDSFHALKKEWAYDDLTIAVAVYIFGDYETCNEFLDFLSSGDYDEDDEHHLEYGILDFFEARDEGHKIRDKVLDIDLLDIDYLQEEIPNIEGY